jgi:hypothetical protein
MRRDQSRKGSACARTPVAGPGVTREMGGVRDAVHTGLEFRNHREINLWTID